MNQLFQMGMGLRALSEKASSTLIILKDELRRTIRVQDPRAFEEKMTIRREDLLEKNEISDNW